MVTKKIEEIFQENALKWMSLEGVVGMAIGMHRKKKCIKIFICSNFTEISSLIPDTINEIEVLIEKTDPFEAFE